MATRKSKQVNEEVKKQKSKLLDAEARMKEVEELLKLSEAEEVELMTSTETFIEKTATDANLFCGIILTRQDVLNIVSLAMETKENIRIPFKLYFND
jgi:hypothetical protein